MAGIRRIAVAQLDPLMAEVCRSVGWQRSLDSMVIKTYVLICGGESFLTCAVPTSPYNAVAKVTKHLGGKNLLSATLLIKVLFF